jgi:hypothetical protein
MPAGCAWGDGIGQGAGAEYLHQIPVISFLRKVGTQLNKLGQPSIANSNSDIP